MRSPWDSSWAAVRVKRLRKDHTGLKIYTPSEKPRVQPHLWAAVNAFYLRVQSHHGNCYSEWFRISYVLTWPSIVAKISLFFTITYILTIKLLNWSSMKERSIFFNSPKFIPGLELCLAQNSCSINICCMSGQINKVSHIYWMSNMSQALF